MGKEQLSSKDRAIFGRTSRSATMQHRGVQGDVLGWSSPVPKGKPVVRPNDERPSSRPFGNDLGARGGHDDVKYFASGRNSADRESVAHLLAARRYPRPKAEE